MTKLLCLLPLFLCSGCLLSEFFDSEGNAVRERMYLHADDDVQSHRRDRNNEINPWVSFKDMARTVNEHGPAPETRVRKSGTAVFKGRDYRFSVLLLFESTSREKWKLLLTRLEEPVMRVERNGDLYTLAIPGEIEFVRGTRNEVEEALTAKLWHRRVLPLVKHLFYQSMDPDEQWFVEREGLVCLIAGHLKKELDPPVKYEAYIRYKDRLIVRTLRTTIDNYIIEDARFSSYHEFAPSTFIPQEVTVDFRPSRESVSIEFNSVDITPVHEGNLRDL